MLKIYTTWQSTTPGSCEKTWWCNCASASVKIPFAFCERLELPVRANRPVRAERMSSVLTVAAKFHRPSLNSSHHSCSFLPDKKRRRKCAWVCVRVRVCYTIWTLCKVKQKCEKCQWQNEIYCWWCKLLSLSLIILSRSDAGWKADLYSRGHLQLA